ncbi:MAG: ABC transporter permease [Proteobacteria bacterium]|nr:ABC transporter permease [Pseudomonadota bacterium]MBS0437215.1 ABC transporter permease [Pseudomonadota bacterium]
MYIFLCKRLLIGLISLVGISFVLFAILALAPGDIFSELVTNPAIPADVIARLREQLGLDSPIHVRYARWLVAMLQGDWGYSYVSRVDVWSLIVQRVPTTLFIVGVAQVVGLAIALPVGVYSAARPYSLFDKLASTLAFVGFSLPTFFTGLLFILLFSVQLNWLPFIYRTNVEGEGWRWAWEMFRQSVMPISVIGLALGAAWTRYVRSAVLEVIRLDHVTTARAKGLPERTVVLKHVLRNALIPVVTLVALEMPAVFGGAIVTEQIFRVPGVGSLLIASLVANDTPVVMAVTFVIAALVVIFNFLADLLYGVLDPRITYE